MPKVRLIFAIWVAVSAEPLTRLRAGSAGSTRNRKKLNTITKKSVMSPLTVLPMSERARPEPPPVRRPRAAPASSPRSSCAAASAPSSMALDNGLLPVVGGRGRPAPGQEHAAGPEHHDGGRDAADHAAVHSRT